MVTPPEAIPVEGSFGEPEHGWLPAISRHIKQAFALYFVRIRWQLWESMTIRRVIKTFHMQLQNICLLKVLSASRIQSFYSFFSIRGPFGNLACVSSCLGSGRSTGNTATGLRIIEWTRYQPFLLNIRYQVGFIYRSSDVRWSPNTHAKTDEISSY